MTRCRFAACTESRCAGAGASRVDRGFVVCIVAWTGSRCAGAFGAAEQIHGFVAGVEGRGPRAAARAAVTQPSDERESAGDQLGGASAAQGRAGAASASLRRASLRSARRSARAVGAIRHLRGALGAT
jgi:hypothetical protein